MRILITGSNGFLGSVVRRQLSGQSVVHAASGRGRTSGFDLRDRHAVAHVLKRSCATHVIHLAYPGSQGIATAAQTPLVLAADCLRIDTNVIEACAEAKVEQLVCVGSVCQYAENPNRGFRLSQGPEFEEHEMLDGAPEAVNAPYGHAKRMQLALLQAAYTQSGLKSVQLVLDNLYGPGDRSGHVIPATIQRCLAARRDALSNIEAWGDGTATREFVYVDDAAEAIVLALTAVPRPPRPVNIVSSQPLAMKELVERIAGLCEYTGEISWDASKPEGQKARWFSGELAKRELGWTPTTSLMVGLAQTVAWWQSQQEGSHG